MMLLLPMMVVWNLPTGKAIDVDGDYMRRLAESDMQTLLFGGARQEDIDSIIEKMDSIQGVRITRNWERSHDDPRAYTMFRYEER